MQVRSWQNIVCVCVRMRACMQFYCTPAFVSLHWHHAEIEWMNVGSYRLAARVSRQSEHALEMNTDIPHLVFKGGLRCLLSLCSCTHMLFFFLLCGCPLGSWLFFVCGYREKRCHAPYSELFLRSFLFFLFCGFPLGSLLFFWSFFFTRSVAALLRCCADQDACSSFPVCLFRRC